MGIFGFACERCWDYNCNCTPEELQAHRNKSKKIKPLAIEWSKSEPFVTNGDIIIKDGIQFFVKAIDNGLPLCDKITNILEEDGCNIIVQMPYSLLTNNSE